MKIFTKTGSMIHSDMLALIVIIISAVTVFLAYRPEKTVFLENVAPMNNGWVTDSGARIDLDDLPKGDITLTHDLDGIDLYRKRLCFKSRDTHITAICDGQVMYSYAPDLPSILGRSYGMYIHMIPIPADAQSVTLKLHPIYDIAPAYIWDAAIEDAGVFMGTIYQENLPSFMLCAVIALFGVLMLILGFTTWQTKERNNVNFFSLGTFSILVAIWSANDTCIIQVFTQHPEMMRFVNFLCLIFISYLPVSIMAKATNHTDSLMLPVLFLLTAINFAVTMIVSLLGVSDVRLMLPFSHINIMVAMCMTIYLMARAVRKKTIEKKFLHAVTIGMSAVAIGVILDIVRFQIFPNRDLGASTFTRIGVLVFVSLIGLHLMRERTRLAIEESRSELMKKMAYTDGLTGIGNRAAFHEKEDEIRRRRSACTVVQLDINFLKRVNDVYGHAEGDKHIRQAADIISRCFDGIGTCFRTGGDEFIVIAEKGSESDVERALTKMEKLVGEYNSKVQPPVPLMIAYGYAFSAEQSDMLETAEKLADDRMYEKKRTMKVQNT